MVFGKKGSGKTFQVVPPCGGHHWCKASIYIIILVSSRAPVWGASGRRRPCQRSRRVSSRAPVWGASAVESGSSVREKFQVVPPCGGHPVELSIKPHSIRFQVVPPCGGHPVGAIL